MSDIKTILTKLKAETASTIERFLGDEEMYLKHIRDFPEEQTMTKIVQAIDAEDYEAAERAIHAFKGIVNNLGFVPLANLSANVLEELSNSRISEALELYEELREQYVIYCDAINQWKNE